MNNREWLYGLDVADLSDWFDAEHVEPDDGIKPESVVKSQSVDANDENVTQDSREKLEADIRCCLGFTTKDVFGWLDRQAAITHSIDAWNIKRLEEERESLQDQVDDLQANLNRANDAFETARLELEEQIAELERECDDLHSRIEQWMNAAGNAHDMWEKADARRVEAERRVSALSEKLSRAYGNAHNTLRMMDEELA